MNRVAVILFALVCLLLYLAKPASGQVWDRDAVFNARVGELQAAIAARPNDPQALADLAAFYLKPLAPRDIEAADGKVRRVMVPLRNEVRGSIKDIVAVAWVWRGDPDAALPLAKRALQLKPGHPTAVRAMAMAYRMKGDHDRMKPFMEAALRNNPMDLDMARLHLDHRTLLAHVLDAQAAELRIGRSWEEHRSDGSVWRVTIPPSAGDYAQADRLHEQAQSARRDAIGPLKHIATVLSKDPKRAADPRKDSTWYLATAIYRAWLGELEASAGSAKHAVEADPTNLDALDYLVDLLRGTRTQDKLAIYKPILDRWGGADSRPVIASEAPRGPRR